jgi:hypothetical protein
VLFVVGFGLPMVGLWAQNPQVVAKPKAAPSAAEKTAVQPYTKPVPAVPADRVAAPGRAAFAPRTESSPANATTAPKVASEQKDVPRN